MIEQQALLDDRYRILEPLGCGGMAEVYLSQDELLGREVALKVLREQYASDEEFVERFAWEARSVASLEHPNIASVYDLGRSRDGRYYITMEYVSGGTLAEYLARKGPLPAPTAAEVAGQVASALAAAHDEGIIHRDVKPQNILITAEGDVKLADFGIARAAANTSVSRTGHVLGTARYMSPEQAMGERTTPRSDLYALGGVLYEILTGEAPFDANTPVAVSLKHVGERPHHPAELNSEVPEEMDAVVMRLLAKSPADRYESAEELAEDLGRLRDGLPAVGAGAYASGFGSEYGGGTLLSAGGEGSEPNGADEAITEAAHKGKSPRRRKLLLSFAPLAVVVLLGAVLLGLSWESGEGGVIGSLDGSPGNALGESPLGEAPLGEAPLGEAPVGEARNVAEDAEQAVFGPQEAKIPDVEGLTEEQARQRLDEQGFGAESRSRQSSQSEAGMVLEQSVPGGKQAEEGSVVLLAVGKGSSTAAGPAEGSGGVDGRASVPDGPGVAGGSANGNSDSGNTDSSNLGGGDSSNGWDGGSSGPTQGPGGYTGPPATDEDEASSGSASAPSGPPETGTPPQASSQPSPASVSPAPTPSPESWQGPASPSPRESAPEPSYQEGSAEPPVDAPVATEEPIVEEPPADPPGGLPAPAVDPIEEVPQPAVPSPEDRRPLYEPSDGEAIDGPTGDQYE